MVSLLLYLLAGIATAIPVVYALGWAVWGAGTSPLEYISLLGSLILVFAAFLSLRNRRFSARAALIGALCAWSFYLPAVIVALRVRLSDQQIVLRVVRWTASNSPLRVSDSFDGNARLSAAEIAQLGNAGLTGTVSNNGYGVYGSGKRSRVILVMQTPVDRTIELQEPNAATIVYVQHGKDWTSYPPKAPTLRRKIRVEPDTDNPSQTMVSVELATGARQGFGVWWPEADLRSRTR